MKLLLRLLVLTFVLSATARAAQRPNILFLLGDDQRWDTIRALGHPDIHTPTLDRLVAQGFYFQNAYCQGSMIGAVCLPSRTMILTGRSLWRVPDMRARATPPGVPVLPTVLSEAGYVTFASGKPGNTPPFGNTAFQTFLPIKRRTVTSATEMADNAIAFLARHDAVRPFFMYLAPSVPHDPRLAPPEFVKRYDPAKIALPRQFMARHPGDPGVLDIRDEKLAAYPRTEHEMRQHLADYYATISHLDAELGRVLAALRERGMEKNTIVIFSSDQGLACGGYHGLMGKQNLYEHVKPPLLVAGPGIPHGRSGALVYLYDLFPTICELAGVKAPEVIEGRSLVPIAQGRTPRVREYLLGAYATVQRMARDERWKLLQFHVGAERRTALFDLQSDPEELRNLADDPRAAEPRARLEAQLAKLRQEFDDSVKE
jgi:arylsulfatase A-like enzyme